MSNYAHSTIRLDSMDGLKVDAADPNDDIFITNSNNMTFFISQSAFNELIQLVQESMRERKVVTAHRNGEREG